MRYIPIAYSNLMLVESQKIELEMNHGNYVSVHTQLLVTDISKKMQQFPDELVLYIHKSSRFLKFSKKIFICPGTSSSLCFPLPCSSSKSSLESQVVSSMTSWPMKESKAILLFQMETVIGRFLGFLR